jgi:hypothetical protein
MRGGLVAKVKLCAASLQRRVTSGCSLALFDLKQKRPTPSLVETVLKVSRHDWLIGFIQSVQHRSSAHETEDSGLGVRNSL